MKPFACKPRRFTFLILFLLIFVSCDSSDHDPVVPQLVSIMNSDAALRGKFEEALARAEASTFWYNKTLADMYVFFDEWLVFQPTPENVRTYMDAFWDFAGTESGRAAVMDDRFTIWLTDFINARGDFMDSQASTGTLNAWLEDPEVNMEDFITPDGGFKSFNQFFTRRIVPGARPVDDPGNPSVLTSPADSTLIDIQNYLTPESEMEIKGDRLNVHKLLGNDPLADAFMGGKAVLCMLDTTDYHRFHAPVSGKIAAEGQLAGLYYGMTGGWVDYFFEHRRGYFIFQTEDFGYVGMACVGMFSISSVVFEPKADKDVEKGDELGHFAYGGSAIILLFEPDQVDISHAIDRRPVHVRMGETIGTKTP